MKFICWYFTTPFLLEELRDRIRKLKEFSSLSLNHKNSKTVQDKILHTLIDILDRASETQLLAEDPNPIISSSIRILSQFNNSSADNSCVYINRKKHNLAKFCYIKLLKIYIPSKSNDLVRIVFNAINYEGLWEIEDLCLKLIWQLIEAGATGATVANALCDQIEQQTFNANISRAIIRTLYQLLDFYEWPDTEGTTIFIERLLEIYYIRLLDYSHLSIENAHSTRGLELCIWYITRQISNDYILIVIRRICSWVTQDKLPERAILDFGSTLEYAAHIHRTTLFKDTLTHEIFPSLLQMISSTDRLINLLGNRVLQYLMDRAKNCHLFDTPRIFFEDFNLHLENGFYRTEDKAFLKLYREALHKSLLNSVMNHYTSRLNLETTYSTICTIAVEIPCGFTAAALVCLIMNIQEKMMLQRNREEECCYHVHAMIVSVMSLMCWIHKAKVFYKYVNKIVTERALWAPHLNPPIQSRYTFATHHVRWQKPDFFFVDWQVRYSLWKCFRSQEKEFTGNDNREQE